MKFDRHIHKTKAFMFSSQVVTKDLLSTLRISVLIMGVPSKLQKVRLTELTCLLSFSLKVVHCSP